MCPLVTSYIPDSEQSSWDLNGCYDSKVPGHGRTGSMFDIKKYDLGIYQWFCF